MRKAILTKFIHLLFLALVLNTFIALVVTSSVLLKRSREDMHFALESVDRMLDYTGHGEVSGDCDIFEIHDVIDRIEKELKEKLGCEAVIHMDPIVVNNEAINETKKEVVDMINEHFPGVTIHDFRMIQGPTHTNLIFDAVVPFQYGKTNEEVKQGIEKLISEKWDDYYAVIQAEQSYLE